MIPRSCPAWPPTSPLRPPPKGKTACKLALQRKVGLREDESAPIIACVSRLVGHKGFSLVTDVLHQIMEMDVQMVVLGTGDWQYEEHFEMPSVSIPAASPHRSPTPAPCPT